jgi:rhodanese-related sulfurtransferase
MVLVLAAACGTAPAAQDTAVKVPLPDEISINQAHELYEQGTFLLDVRTPEEWDDYHIEGATLIPLDELQSRVDELPQDEDIVVVCRSGNRSQVGRDILRQAGINQSTSMAGGVKEWYAAGYPTVGSP